MLTVKEHVNLDLSTRYDISLKHIHQDKHFLYITFSNITDLEFKICTSVFKIHVV